MLNSHEKRSVRHRLSLLSALAGLGVTLLAAPGAAASPPFDPRLDPQAVDWRMLRFHASKLFVSANAEVRFERMPASAAAAELSAVPEGSGRSPGGSQVVRLHVESKLGGKETHEDVWFDAADGSALERRKERLGKKPYIATVRYGTDGVYRHRIAPAKDREAHGPRERWSGLETSFEPFDRASGGLGEDSPQRPVIEPLALFYLVSAAHLEAPGDRLETVVFSRHRLVPIRLEVSGIEQIRANFEDRTQARTERRRGPIEALKIRVEDAGGADSDFSFLGLREGVEIFVERSSRLPVLVRGKMRIVGRVDIALTHAERR